MQTTRIPNIQRVSAEDDISIAVLIPCFNEEVAIPKVVTDFRNSLPTARIYVYDNNSTDETQRVAAESGAIVCSEELQGKGNVVRRMFADVDADVYVMVDGDDTYEAEAAPALIRRLLDRDLDMVNAARVTDIKQAYRHGHRFGNAMLTQMVASLFGNRFDDILSGYRVFSRRFVKSFPALSSGFEIETELTVHALHLRMPVGEVTVAYRDRPEGSVSKLNTIKDGVRIVRTILLLLKQERPMYFFSVIGAALVILSLGLAWPILIEYMETGLVPRFPTAILSTGIMLLAFLSFAVGLVLDTVTRGRLELKRLLYLSIPRVRASADKK